MSGSLSRRDVFAALSLSLALGPAAGAAPSPENDALIARAIGYLEDLTSVKGRFEQSDQRGVVATGTIWLARPGRARFEYDPPSGLLITSDGKTVIVSNSRLKTFQRLPLTSTPLAIFLAQHIRLDRGAHVTRVDRTADGFSISARDSRGLAQGDITLYFLDAPLRLTGWVIIDAQARLTRVTLTSLAPVPTPSADAFTQTPESSAAPPGM
jgi:outer membrane lipoprotein-sorting protein